MVLTVLLAAKGLRPAQVDVEESLLVLTEMELAEGGKLIPSKGSSSVKVLEKIRWGSVRKDDWRCGWASYIGGGLY